MTALDRHDPCGRDDRDDLQVVDRFILLFDRKPNAEELLLFRFAEARLHLRLPGRARRRAICYLTLA